MAKRQLKDFLNVRKAQGTEWPTKSLIYSWRFFNTLDFNDCVSKVGRKIFIDDEKFEEWMTRAMKETRLATGKEKTGSHGGSLL